MALNCWEIKLCGREPGGTHVKDLGVCRAATQETTLMGLPLNGINDGINGGRICWAIAGTLCGGKVQGTYAEKKTTCLSCEVFTQVQAEQKKHGLRFQIEPKHAAQKRS